MGCPEERGGKGSHAEILPSTAQSFDLWLIRKVIRQRAMLVSIRTLAAVKMITKVRKLPAGIQWLRFSVEDVQKKEDNRVFSRLLPFQRLAQPMARCWKECWLLQEVGTHHGLLIRSLPKGMCQRTTIGGLIGKLGHRIPELTACENVCVFVSVHRHKHTHLHTYTVALSRASIQH